MGMWCFFAINVSGPDEDGFGHSQHDQWRKIAPHALVGGVIGNTLENLCQYDAAQGNDTQSPDLEARLAYRNDNPDS